MAALLRREEVAKRRKPVDPTAQAARITRRGTLITALATVIAALIAGVFAACKVGNEQGVADAPPRTVTVTATAPGHGAPPASTGAAQASAGCPKAVADDKQAPGGEVVLSAGSQFCLRTSEGKLFARA
ncbi:hypothetical protein [Amycolatopsis sp. NPDC051102]|uniref:hypothetical protein n=1 Tax=Amycolatopsis sp. NPDC051102 TaxID=3155163 RepID=UPI00341C8A94